MELRPYQEEAVQSLFRWFEERQDNPLVVMPTGTGKSVVIAEFIRRAVQAYYGTRVVSLTHVKELIEQNCAALLRVWGDAPVGIYSASVGRKDINSQIIFAGIQSIYKKAYSVQQCDLVPVDEAHLMPRNAETMYGKFISEIQKINPHAKLIGFTATPFRLDSGRLDRGDGALFGGIAYEYDMATAIKDGYLSELVSKSTGTTFDVSGVKKRGGEFIDADLERVFDVDDKNQDVVTEILDHADGRGSCLVFATGVDHATHLRDILRQRGRSSEVVHGGLSKTERRRILEAFKAGDLWSVVNVNVLTTGFDAPGVDLIALVRATMSPGLYIQMCGRGARLAPGKDNCLVLDFAENIDRHGPVDQPRVKEPGEGGDGEAPVKICESCQMYNYAGARVCKYCGHEFPPPEPKYEGRASSTAVLSFQQQNQWIDIMDVGYHVHSKIGRPTSMRVTYITPSGSHNEWVCFEHSGFAKEKAHKWWSRRTGGAAPPQTTHEAIERRGELMRPEAICVKPHGKYTEITRYRFPPVS